MKEKAIIKNFKNVTSKDVSFIEVGDILKGKKEKLAYKLINITNDEESVKEDKYFHFPGFVVKGRNCMSKIFEKGIDKKFTICEEV